MNRFTTCFIFALWTSLKNKERKKIKGEKKSSSWVFFFSPILSSFFLHVCNSDGGVGEDNGSLSENNHSFINLYIL